MHHKLQRGLRVWLLCTQGTPLSTVQSPPPPPCESNALVRATVGVASATLGTMSYFATYNPPPFVRAMVGVVSVKFWDFSVVSQGRLGVLI